MPGRAAKEDRYHIIVRKEPPGLKKEELRSALARGLTGSMTLVFVVVLYFLLQNLGNLLSIANTIGNAMRPFILGGVIAYLLRLPCDFFEEKFDWHFSNKDVKRFHTLVEIGMIVLTLIALYSLVSIIIPELVRSVNQLISALPGAAQRMLAWARTAFADDPDLQNTVNSLITTAESRLQTWISSDLMPLLQSVLGGFASAFTSVAGALYDLLVGFIVCVYILFSRHRLARHGKSIINAVLKPSSADTFLRELRHVDETFSGFFGGKLLDSLIVGIICYVFCIIMSMIRSFPNGMLVSVIVGISNIIPYFGPIVGGVISALLIMINDPVNALIFIIFILVLQQIDGNILGPHILSGSVGLPGIWVLFSITFFGGLFGFVGILAGVPAFAVIYDAIRRLTCRGLRKHGRMYILQGTEPPSEPAADAAPSPEPEAAPEAEPAEPDDGIPEETKRLFRNDPPAP